MEIRLLLVKLINIYVLSKFLSSNVQNDIWFKKDVPFLSLSHSFKGIYLKLQEQMLN